VRGVPGLRHQDSGRRADAAGHDPLVTKEHRVPCQPFRFGDGHGLVCSRGARRQRTPDPCFSRGCTTAPTTQCDYVVSAAGEAVRTCDRYCCPRHGRRVGEDKDHCLEHFLKAKSRSAELEDGKPCK
jgi:hypothetical protein